MILPLMITPASVAPVSLEEVKQHLRIDHNDEDVVLQTYIDAASGFLGGSQGILGKVLVGETWRQTYSEFASPMALAAWPTPVSAVSQIQFYDADNAIQLLDPDVWTWGYAMPEFAPATFSRTGGNAVGIAITLVPGQAWPTTYVRDDAVLLDYVAGYGQPNQVPAPIRRAILILVGDFYARREASAAGSFAELPYAMRMTLSNYRAAVI